MSQIRALVYKEAVQARTRWLSYGCTMITPVIAIMLLYYVRSVVDSYDIKSLILDKDAVLPASFVICNLLNYESVNKFAELQNFYKIENPIRVVKYGLKDKSKLDDAENFFSTFPTGYYYKIYNRTVLPKYKYVEAEDNMDLNRKLIEALLSLQNRSVTWWNMDTPDASVWFDKFDLEKGFDATIQQNNPMNSNQVRRNGYNLIYFKLDKNSSHHKVRIPTEGYISTMNMLNNKFLLNSLPQRFDVPIIISGVSPTYDSTYFLQFLEAGYATVGVILFPISMSLGFPITLLAITTDKVKKVRSILDINGLRPINYWLAYLIFFMIMLLASNSAFFIIAYSKVQIDFFQKTSGLILLLLTIGWNYYQTCFAFFISTFVESTATSVFLGYIVSTLLMILSSACSLFVIQLPEAMPASLLALPQASLVRSYYTLFFECLANDCAKSIWTMPHEMTRCLVSMYVGGSIYFGLTLVLNEPAVVDFLKTKLVQIKASMTKKQVQEIKVNKDELQDTSVSVLEDDALKADSNDRDIPLLVRNISKVYKEANRQTIALSDVNMILKPGKIFGLLGPNGAGKTTLLSIISGVVEQSIGSVFLNGCKAIPGKRTHIGYCPQFDILFDDLTVKQHLVFFSIFKGSSISQISQQVTDSIARVSLEDKADSKVTKLSGGMRRRCSLAIALVGTSNLILLDEPSSGLDPRQRRIFWKTVKDATKGRTVILTTHLMEEADVLCDDIAIIVKGGIRTFGTATYLKNLYAVGTKLQIVWIEGIEDEQLEEAMDRVKELCAALRLLRRFENIYDYLFTSKSGSAFSDLFSLLEQLRGKTILEWSISKNNLEEVFLSVVDKYSKPPKIETDGSEASLNESQMSLPFSPDVYKYSELEHFVGG